MARNLRNHVVIGTESGTERTVSGGPIYTVSYTPGGPPTTLSIGDHVYIEKREAGAGTGSTLLSTYVLIERVKLLRCSRNVFASSFNFLI